jgi:hypothetical protein
MGVQVVLRTKNFVENVDIKDRGELLLPPVFKDFGKYGSPVFYDCPRPN